MTIATYNANRPYLLIVPIIAVLLSSCTSATTPGPKKDIQDDIPATTIPASIVDTPKNYRSIHVFVALCDNKYQGIVPVPAGIGNGQDANTNLYWGAGYGIRSYFKRKDSEWLMIQTIVKPAPHILERILFRHKKDSTFLLADAYDGRSIKNTTIDFLQSCAGQKPLSVTYGPSVLKFGGDADLLAYIGHDGLMDFKIDQEFTPDTSKHRAAMILACYSKHFFSPHLAKTGATPLLWTSHLMAPEAYTLHDAIGSWIKNEHPAAVRMAAAKAYAKYQRCSVEAAKRLLVQGW